MSDDAPVDAVAAKDLTREEPRGFGETLEGYAHLPRMFDKARATLAGTNGTYLFGCPVDHTAMARLGVAPELILDLLARDADDHDVLAALREHGIPAAEEAWFDSQAVEDEMQEQGIYLRVRRHAAVAELEAAGHVVSVDRIEAASQPPHAHATTEVVVVESGRARFSLGERQARIVRAGEAVRIPAAIAHGFEALGDEPLRAVAVQLA